MSFPMMGPREGPNMTAAGKEAVAAHDKKKKKKRKYGKKMAGKSLGNKGAY